MLHRLSLTTYTIMTSTFAATIMDIGYGISVQESDDPYILIAEEASAGFSAAGVPGAFWVDMVPILKYVPSWFPGAGFKKKAARWREARDAMAERPFCHVQEQLVQVHFFSSILSKINSTEKWNSYAIRGSKSHRTSSW